MTRGYGQGRMRSYCLFDGYSVLGEDEKDLGIDCDDRSTALCMYLMPLTCTLTDGENGKYYIHIFYKCFNV